MPNSEADLQGVMKLLWNVNWIFICISMQFFYVVTCLYYCLLQNMNNGMYVMVKMCSDDMWIIRYINNQQMSYAGFNIHIFVGQKLMLK